VALPQRIGRIVGRSEIGPTEFWDLSTLPEMHFIV
jgi:hypothetical protein